MNARLLPTWVSWAIAVLATTILAWLIVTTDAPVDMIDITIGSVLVLIVAQTAHLAAESLRMQTVLEQAAGMRFERWHMLGLFVKARVLNLVVPQSGNVYRIAGIKDRYDAAISETVGGMAGFVWLSVSASLALSTLLFAVGLGDASTSTAPSAVVLALLAVGSITAPWFVLAIVSRMQRENGFVSKLIRAADAALGVVHSSRTLLTFMGYWVITIAVIVVMYATAFSMVGPVPTVPALIAIYALVQATSFVVITPGNIGIQDLGFTAVAVIFGSDPGAAAAAALIIRVSGIGVTAAAAVIASIVGSDETADLDHGLGR